MLACGGKSSREQVRTDEPTAPVALRVVDEIGAPVSETAVLIDGALVTTDADGQAASSEVPATYDVAVVVGTHAYAFLGMTTRSPVLKLRASVAPDSTSTATVELPSDLTANGPVSLIAGVTDTPSDEQSATSGYGDHGLMVATTWRGTSDATLSVEAITNATKDGTEFGAIVGYSGYAKLTLDAAPGADVPWQPELTEVPFDTVSIHVDVDLGGDDRMVTCSSELEESSGAVGALAALASNSGSIDLPVLDIPGARYVIDADVRSAPVQGIHTTSDGFHATQLDVAARASIHLETGPFSTNVAPKNGTMIEPDTMFSWTAGDGAVNVLSLTDYMVGFSDEVVTHQFALDIATSGLEATIPDLSALGFALPAAVSIQWNVSSQFGHASVDDYAAGEPSTGYGYSAPLVVTAAP
jgi:hypothetical protein